MLNNYREVIWLVGDGRSGTTWVANLINHDKRYREMFEPFHLKFVREAGFIEPHQYYRPHHVDDRLITFALDVFTGRFTNARVDHGNHAVFYNGLLIKDIFANLLCYSVSLELPHVKPVLLIRNPFSVALSKIKKKDWFWLTEPLDLLRQVELYEDYLYQLEDMVRETSSKRDYILNQILIWSIINYIPLRQFNPGDIHVCFYEEIYKKPDQEISNILRYVRGEGEGFYITLDKEAVCKPSSAIGVQSNMLSGTSPILSWKNELSHQVIDDGLRILQHFGFDDLYDDASMPDMNVLSKIHRAA
jgi:hypothetical protein